MSIQIRNKEDKVYVVLGVPKSATSFISKMLEENGVEMHNDKRENYLPQYEDTRFIRLNDKILRSAGTKEENFGLKRPAPEEKVLKTNFNEEIKRLIRKRKSKSWGWKDPRTSLTMKKFLPYLEGDVYLICCFRKPAKITKSTQRWNIYDSKGLTKEKIDVYNRSIISAIKEFVDLR
jgi:hypothetical protein